MENDIRRFILHHGTINKNSTLILKNKVFLCRKRDDHWLGNGIYFFVDDLSQAFLWSNLSKRKEIQYNKQATSKELEKRVLEVDFMVEKSKYLNLDSRSDRIKLDDFINELHAEKTNITKDDKHEEMCTIMDVFVKYSEIKASKYTFTNNHGSKKLNNIGIENHGEQFCIYGSQYIDFSEIIEKEEEVQC